MKRQVIIDCNNLCYSNFYSFGDLSYEEKKTGVIFGFVKNIISLAKTFDTDEFIFCWDSRKSYRKLFYPEYKANRRKNLPEQEVINLKLALEQFTELRTVVLPMMGFGSIFFCVGYEADDIIATVANMNEEQDKSSIVVVSTDQDMYQLLNKVVIYNQITKKKITYETFVEKYKTVPSLWSEVKAISGCSSDNVIGITGVGETKAIKYLNGMLLKGKIKDRIESDEGQEIIARNRKLVCLPFKGMKNLTFVLKADCLKKSNFIDVFMKYGFESLLKKNAVENWSKIFNFA